MSPRIRIPWSRRSPPPGLSCRELVELITDYWDGALAPVDRARFEGHVGHCGHCAAYLEQLQLTVEITHRLEPEALRPEVEHELLAAFATWKQQDGA